MTGAQAFSVLEMRVGRVQSAERHPRARKPSYQLIIDFGPEIGTKNSSAQIVELYRPEDLEGRLVVCAMNLGSRNIAGFVSEVLTLGVADSQGRVVLLQPEREVPLGSRVY
jgi:tRNA-binding protein